MMSGIKRSLAVIAGLALLSGCAAPPMGPSVGAVPPPNKPFQVFQQDDFTCKQYASGATSGQAEQANNQAVGSAVIGTALGAGLGAAIGGGRGAAIGAASGAAVGTGYGANSSQYAQMSIQQQYDNAYAACMVSKGNQVQGYAPPGYQPPPPPPGSGWSVPPPPPPGY
jgi:hypothetical protein